jgi:hypothetical protein
MVADFVQKYLFAKTVVIDEGYSFEVLWQANLRFDCLDETHFLKELAWVILTCGMREKVIRNIFPSISKCFYDWSSATIIVKNKAQCFQRAIKIFNNTSKISAIISAALKIRNIGFPCFKRIITENPIENLQKFSYIGPVTVYHLAKNIGLPVAKPDRHLKRIANIAGYSNVQLFCDEISKLTGDPIPVVDIVLWRFATIERDYLNVFTNVNV